MHKFSLNSISGITKSHQTLDQRALHAQGPIQGYGIEFSADST